LGDRVGAAPTLVAKGVVAKREQPSGERHLGDLASSASGDPVAEAPEHGIVQVRTGGRFHHRPSQPARSLLGDVAAAGVLGAAALGGGEPGPRAQVLR
jgi:hypothetical protein